MNVKQIVFTGAAAIWVVPAPVLAEQNFISGGISTLGFGLEAGRYLNDRVVVRAGMNGGSYSRTLSETDIDYDADFRFNSLSLLADWHPFAGTFHLTAGGLYNRNRLDLEAEYQEAVRIGGVTYQIEDLGTLEGRVDFRDISPYLGLGWSSAPSHAAGFSLSAEVGALYQNSPQVTLRGVCNAGPVVCAGFDEAVRREENTLRDELADYKWWPVLSLAVRYRF